MNPKSILELRHFILSINVIDKKKHILQKKFDYGCHRGFGSSPFLQKIWVSRLKELWNDFHRSLRNSLKLHILGRLCQGISIIRRLNRFFILHLWRFFCCFLHFFYLQESRPYSCNFEKFSYPNCTWPWWGELRTHATSSKQTKIFFIENKFLDSNETSTFPPYKKIAPHNLLEIYILRLFLSDWWKSFHDSFSLEPQFFGVFGSCIQPFWQLRSKIVCRKIFLLSTT